MYPCADPTSQIGQLEREISDVKSRLSNKADGHDVASALSRLDSLERAVEGIRSDFARLDSEQQATQEKIRQACEILLSQ